MRTRDGWDKNKHKIMKSFSVDGVLKGQKIDEPKIVEIDVSQIRDSKVPIHLKGQLGEYSDRIQQSVTGSLLNVSYSLRLIAYVNGNLCYNKPPNAEIQVEIVAPDKSIQFMQVLMEDKPPEDALGKVDGEDDDNEEEV